MWRGVPSQPTRILAERRELPNGIGACALERSFCAYMLML